jgi:large subunit ribosomal protein L28
MSKVCDICGKGPIVVNSVTRRGKARAAGGVGRKVTGVSKSRQVPNLQSTLISKGGVSIRMRVCIKCMRQATAA